MIKTCLALLTTAALGLAASAHADLTWDWSFTFNGNGEEVYGSGTLTTDPLSGGAYVITGISGTYFTHPLTTYSILGLDSAGVGAITPDNMLYTPGNNGTSPADNAQLSVNGLGFYFGPAGGPVKGNTVIFDDPGDGAYVAKDSLHDTGGGTFTATLVPAPEPSQVISMLSLAGLGGAGFLLNLRRRK